MPAPTHSPAQREYSKKFSGLPKTDMSSTYEAEDWLISQGYSVSPRCEIKGSIFVAVMKGKGIHIPKFTILNSVEREQLAGKIVSTKTGAARVTLKENPRGRKS